MSILALFYQGDVRWENQFRRNRNRQNFVVGSYDLTACESSENPGAANSGVTLSQKSTCGSGLFLTDRGRARKKPKFLLKRSV